MKQVVQNLKNEMVILLSDKLRLCLSESVVEITALRSSDYYQSKAVLDIDYVVKRFMGFLEFDFDKLVSAPTMQRAELSGYKLSLVSEDFFESANALEGMVAFSRNTNIREYIAFTTRMTALLSNSPINESNNPIDPESIGEALVDALRPIALNGRDTLVVYRKFNAIVLHALGPIIARANQILIDCNIDPDLEVAAKSGKDQLLKRNRNRSDTDPLDRAFFNPTEKTADNQVNGAPELFALIQKLSYRQGQDTSELGLVSSHSSADNKNALMAIPYAAIEGQEFESVPPAHEALTLVNPDTDQRLQKFSIQEFSTSDLLDALTKMQVETFRPEPDADGSNSRCLRVSHDICNAIQKNVGKNVLAALDIQAYQIINTITMIYDRIEKDLSFIDPIRNLITSTQVAVIKLALKDKEFFEEQQHPVRTLLNLISNAGLSSLDATKLEKDTTYRKMKEVINRLVFHKYEDAFLVSKLVQDFESFLINENEKARDSIEYLIEAKREHSRTEKVKAYVEQILRDRVLEELDPVTEEVLFHYFRDFVVDLVAYEGIGSNSWKHVISTVDELLWSVRKEKLPGDSERFEKINPRLMSNLNKAFDIAGIEKSESKSVLSKLQALQIASFSNAINSEKAQSKAFVRLDSDLPQTNLLLSVGNEDIEKDAIKASGLDDYLSEVDRLPLGAWLEFSRGDRKKITCTLAAKVDGKQKLVFINRQGVKLMDKSRTSLALEFQARSVKIVSDTPLFERAMEAVIGMLRQSQSNNLEYLTLARRH